MKEEGENHLPTPLAGCPCPYDGPISAAPPKTSMTINHYICILKSYSSVHMFTFKCPYVHIQVFHILYHYTMKLLRASKSFLPGGSIVKNQK